MHNFKKSILHPVVLLRVLLLKLLQVLPQLLLLVFLRPVQRLLLMSLLPMLLMLHLQLLILIPEKLVTRFLLTSS